MRHNTSLNKIVNLNLQKRVIAINNLNKTIEAAFLRSQITPHFLYNTLTMLSGMATEGAGEQAAEAADALARIYRRSVQGKPLVTLREELDTVRDYLSIQTSRFADWFTVRYQIAPQACHAVVPCMLLQPLLENAILHGLRNAPSGGQLTIGAVRDRTGNLLLWVTDTGTGMQPEAAETLQKSLRKAAQRSAFAENAFGDTEQTHIGLYNVGRRLALHYGGAARITVHTAAGRGTSIRIRIPQERRADASPCEVFAEQKTDV